MYVHLCISTSHPLCRRAFLSSLNYSIQLMFDYHLMPANTIDICLILLEQTFGFLLMLRVNAAC